MPVVGESWDPFKELLETVDCAYPDGLVRRCLQDDESHGESLALYVARELREFTDSAADSREAARRLAEILQVTIDELAGVVSPLIARSRGA